MGQGIRRLNPALVMLREYLPKVVTTATSVCRTWKVKSIRAKISTRTAPVTILIGFRFIDEKLLKKLLLGGFAPEPAQHIWGDFILQVQPDGILGIGGDDDIFAGGADGAGEGLQKGALRVDFRP